MSTDDGSQSIVRLTRENIQLRDKLSRAEARIEELQMKLSQQAVHVYQSREGAAPKSLDELVNGKSSNNNNSKQSPGNAKQQQQGDVVPAEEFDRLEEDLEASRASEKALRAELELLKSRVSTSSPLPQQLRTTAEGSALGDSPPSQQQLATIKALQRRIEELESSEKRLQSAVQDLNDILESIHTNNKDVNSSNELQAAAPPQSVGWDDAATPLLPPPSSGALAINVQSTFQAHRVLRSGNHTVGSQEVVEDHGATLYVDLQSRVDTLQHEVLSWQELSAVLQTEVDQTKKDLDAATRQAREQQVLRQQAEERLRAALLAGGGGSLSPGQQTPTRQALHVSPSTPPPNAANSSQTSSPLTDGGDSSPTVPPQQQNTPKHLLVIIHKLERQNKALEQEVQQYKSQASAKHSEQMAQLTERCLQYTNEVALLKEELESTKLDKEKAMKAGKRAFLDRRKALDDLNDLQKKRDDDKETQRKHQLMVALQGKTNERNDEKVKVCFSGAWNTMEAIQAKLAQAENRAVSGSSDGTASSSIGFEGADDWASLVCEALFDYERRLWNSNNENLSLQTIVKLNHEDDERQWLRKQRELEEEIEVLRENMRDGVKLAEEIRELKTRLRLTTDSHYSHHHAAQQHTNLGAVAVGRVVSSDEPRPRQL